MAMSKKQKIMAAVLASFAGVSGATVASAVIAYEAVFPRYERPNYDLYPGQYCIERMPELSRRELWIPSDDVKLKAHVYEAKNSKGLIVLAHGIHAGGDDYLPIIKYMVDNGYSVLAHNTTGTYESEGDSTVGMCQSLVDIYNVIGYVQESAEYGELPLFTMGHSWGGYAASSVLAMRKGIKASALLAPMRNGATMMVEKGTQYAGKMAKAVTPVFNTYQKVLFGKFTEYDGVRGINESGIPVLIAQGIDDKTITFDGQSITAQMDKITNPNVEYYFGRGLQGDHNNIWHSERAACYQLRIESDFKLMELQRGRRLTDEEKIEYYKTVDHALYSEVNYELMERIVSLFDNAL